MSLSGAAGARTYWRLAKLRFLRLSEKQKQLAAMENFDEGVRCVAEHVACCLEGRFSACRAQIDIGLDRTFRAKKSELIDFQISTPPRTTRSLSMVGGISTDGYVGG